MSTPWVAEQKDLVRVYVWDWPVRLIHWTVVAAMIVLTATGIYVARPFVVNGGPASGHFLMGWTRIVHFYAAIAFTLAVVARFVWMFVGNEYARWRALVPASKSRLHGLLDMVTFYAFPRGHPPVHAGHNPLAGLSYLGFYTASLAIIVTGMALYALSAHFASPTRPFAWLVPYLGGPQTVRWLHHVLMWILLLFAVLHMYIALLVARIERNGTIDSIISGWKYVKRGHEHE